MLYEFVTTYRDSIIDRARAKLTARPWPSASSDELENGVPLFLTQLSEKLRSESTGAAHSPGAIGSTATRHGRDLLALGFSVSQVVHDYGDICQAVTELAIELEIPIGADEFRTLNGCLDEAIARAVTEFAHPREESLSHQRPDRRMAFFAHELRNLLNSAFIAFEVLKSGTVGVGGSTGALLARSLTGLRDLIDRSLAEVRLEAELYRQEPVALAEFMEEVEVAAAIAARARTAQLTVTPIEGGIAINVDRQLLAAALANLLQNAFKFSRPNGHVVLRTDTATAPDRVLIEVEDECGGLPAGRTEDLFGMFEQRGTDRSGLGVGLAIARAGVEVNGGEIRVRDLPGRGCIFTIDLPRLAAKTATSDVVAPRD
jgi:signal transduction histidine kinase